MQKVKKYGDKVCFRSNYKSIAEEGEGGTYFCPIYRPLPRCVDRGLMVSLVGPYSHQPGACARQHSTTGIFYIDFL
jgi:hypothetical protein